MTRTEKNKKKILLVEDEPIVGRLCTRILNAEGFEVDFVPDGRMAMRAVENTDYDLCVSDIRLPGLTGIELYERLKENKPELSLRMIFITGDTMNVNVRSFIQESGIPCLMKPFTPEKLVAAVKALLE
ncbi:MAG: hypothetical protein A2Y58_02000 [Chloroflexi bacterium RBG_13_51_52]|nr:MAG: hypothetical protein A2Y58_02000 [Chloroflexi bacterium RBG_13_51_52]